MVYAQMCKHKSLSDLAIVFQSKHSKWYHLGIVTTISESNISRANENRVWRFYAEYAYILIPKANQTRDGQNEFVVKVDGNSYVVNSATIDLYLNILW